MTFQMVGKLPERSLFVKVMVYMKLTTFMLLIGAMHVSARGYSQDKITLSLKQVPIQKAFTAIQEQTGYHFWYDADLTKLAKPVSIDIKDGSLQDALTQCFKDEPFTYSITEKFILVKLRENAASSSNLPGIPSHDIKGTVVNENGEPLEGVSVFIQGTSTGTATDAKGMFELPNVPENATLVISHIGYERQSFRVNGQSLLRLVLKPSAEKMGEATVTVSNGYQRIPKDRVTGSFDYVDNDLINRSTGSYILDRIVNLTPGLLSNGTGNVNGIPNSSSTTNIVIRGQSTLFGSSDPLIVLDDFPYDGSLANINPNDIESVSILKDAAAASIWGARAANGVIVITTKKGKTGKPRVNLNTDIISQGRPNLFKGLNVISPSDYIGLEQFLYAKGFYASDFNNPSYPYPVTPVVQLLNEVDSGALSATAADAQINAMKSHDVRTDISKYMYQPSVNQQYALNVSGNTPNVNYYLSGGWDHNLATRVGQKYDRISLRSQNSFRLTDKFTLDAGLSYVEGINENGTNPGYNITGLRSIYPYAHLVDPGGNPVPINLYLNPSFVSASERQGLLDWMYNPITNIHTENNTVKTRDFLINTGIHYKILPFLTAEIKYQFENQLTGGNDYYSDSSYYARNLINEFTAVSGTKLTYPIPVGGILMLNNTEIVSQQGRAELNYNQSFKGGHEVVAIGGYEIRSLVTTNNSSTLYGYNQQYSSSYGAINYNSLFPSYFGHGSSNYIPGQPSISESTDHFLSYFSNLAYTFQKKYTVTGSIRKDEANLFGVNTNQKGSPFFSTGLGWTASNEAFYHSGWLPFLKVRATYGYNGNISRLATGVETATYGTSNYNQEPTATIRTPPNANLKWERTGIYNFGLDFSAYKEVIEGTIEFYWKNIKGLMGQAPIDPTLGFATNANAGVSQPFFYENIAGINGRGTDINLASHNIIGKFSWTTNYVFSYAFTKVTKYLLPVALGSTYLNSAITINPVLGRPVYSMYSYRWMGLNPQTGDPQGYLNGKASEDWNTITGTTKLDTMVYSGSMQPLYFGAIRNTFAWNNLSLSFNISYKFKYYFRKPGLNYSNLFNTWTGSGDYAKRWQQPGDELKTNVPSLVYPANSARDNFYDNSSVLVEKADNIRLEDVNIGYDINKSRFHSLPFNDVRFYVYASNLGILWRANKDGIDPYYNNIPVNARSYSFGLNVTF